MAKKNNSNPGINVFSAFRWIRPYLLPILAATFLTLLCLVIVQRVERFLFQSPRFALRLPGPDERGSPNLRIAGVVRVPAQDVRRVFREDGGESVFKIALSERRAELKQLPWVQDASISRIWPNRLDVRISERTPVAFVQLSSDRRGAPSKPKLIDSDGVLLPVQEKRDYALPVLTGIREDHDRDRRAARVQQMQRLLSQLGTLGKDISEIDLRDPENVKVVYPTDRRAVTLILGNEEWRPRLEKFLRHYPEIRKQMPNAIELDLRLKDRILATQVEKEMDGE